jgi:hypothetical protein
MFVIVVVAPDSLVFLQRNREKFVQVCVVNVDEGFRCFTAGRRYLYVVTKHDTAERRAYANLAIAEAICGRDVAEYDEDVALGIILVADEVLFLAHGNAISVWR